MIYALSNNRVNTIPKINNAVFITFMPIKPIVIVPPPTKKDSAPNVCHLISY